MLKLAAGADRRGCAVRDAEVWLTGCFDATCRLMDGESPQVRMVRFSRLSQRCLYGTKDLQHLVYVRGLALVVTVVVTRRFHGLVTFCPGVLNFGSLLLLGCHIRGTGPLHLLPSGLHKQERVIQSETAPEQHLQMTATVRAVDIVIWL